jgi:hypothetical protein
MAFAVPALAPPVDIDVDVDPMPLPTLAWGVPDALAAVAEARLDLPFRLCRPKVVAALTSVVLRAGRHAVKVYPPGTDPVHLQHIADRLAGTRTAVLPLHPPMVTSHGVVAVSRWLRASPAVDWVATGALLAAFHDEHAEAVLAPWTPLRRLPSQVAGLPEEAAAVLLAARQVLLGALDAVGSDLGLGAIHGDVSPSNVLLTPAGPRLIDLDFVAHGPREYDLTSAARRHATGEIDDETYLGFCRAYGHDVRSWDGLTLLDRLAELGGVAFRLWDDRRHGRGLDWLDGTVEQWRTAV